MNTPKEEKQMNKTTAEEITEQTRLYCYNISKTIQSLASHPEHFKLILALAGADVAQQIEKIYMEFIESEGKVPIELTDPVFDLVRQKILITEAEVYDKIADTLPVEGFKGMITQLFDPNLKAS